MDFFRADLGGPAERDRNGQNDSYPTSSSRNKESTATMGSASQRSAHLSPMELHKWDSRGSIGRVVTRGRSDARSEISSPVKPSATKANPTRTRGQTTNSSKKTAARTANTTNSPAPNRRESTTATMAQLIRRTAAATNPKNVTVIDNKAISPKPTLFRLIGKSPNRSRRNSFTSPGLTLAWPTHNGAVVQLARPSLTLRDYVMRLPTTLTLPSTTS